MLLLTGYMGLRKYLAGMLALLVSVTNVNAQQTIPSAYSQTVRTNYIRTWDAVRPETDPNNLMINVPLSAARINTQYADGLGRSLQTVSKEGSLVTGSTATDLVSAELYDAFGREVVKYLPFTANNYGGNTSINDGLLKLNPFFQQAEFYRSTNSASPITGQGETWLYGQTFFEPSPLNRVTETFAAGNNWSGTSAQALEINRRSTKIKYLHNSSIDAVRVWNVADAVLPSMGSYSSPGVYAAGELVKNITIDEQGKQVIEFKDKDGRTVLKKVQHTATADNGSGADHAGWLCTYYVYDNYGNLRCVIQPRGVELIAPTWTLTDPIILAEQCFRYEYDARNRMVLKKVPGAGEVYLVYDTRDRMVMMQDAKLRLLNKWMVTLYDGLNRPEQTGLLLNTWNSNSFTAHLAAAYNSSAYPFTSANTPTGTYWEYLSKTGYDSYSSIPASSSLNATFDASWASHFSSAYNSSPLYAQQQLPTTQTMGLVTWTETKIVNTSTYQYAVSIYDAKARVIQVKSKNLTGGTDVFTTQYNWAGQPLYTVQKLEKAGAPAQTTVMVTQLSYDNLSRLVKTERKISNTQVNANAMSAYKTVAELEYDALGQLKLKKLGSKAGVSGTPLAKIEMEYNIRGWLLSINKNYISNSNADQYFGMELGYDKNPSLGSFTSPQYNGNISGMIWKAEGDQQRRKYDFTYDAVNRLTGANFNQYASGTGSSAVFNKTAGIDFSVSNLSFDANGNILTMDQYGLKLTSSPLIDQLSYVYQTNSNKLAKVTDGIVSLDNGKLGDFKDGSNGSAVDYDYDVNGNLNLDQNKQISAIGYNYLNLPEQITVTGKGSVTYTYDAMGNKLKKTTVETSATVTYNGANYTSSITTTTTYLAGAVYESKAYGHASLASLQYTDRLLFIGQEEGRIRFRPDNNTLQYDYLLKDHLGNVRTLLTEEQQTDMYPAATMETASAASEETLYSNLPATRVTVPAGYPANTPAGNARVAKTSGAVGGNKIGPSITLRVMAGDKFHVSVNSWWKSTNTPTLNPPSPITELLAALNNSIGGITGTHGGATVTELGSSNLLSPGATSYLASQTYTSTKPKAYLNWVLFDDRFNYVSAGSGFEQVGNSDVYTTHTRTNLTVAKTGYLYIYVSNVTDNIDVFFDNLQVTHVRGPILEETEYYPFGLTMSGISSKALAFGSPENKYKYNKGSELQSKEFSDGSGLDWYATNLRSLDPQLGRWWQIDPKPDYAQSLYSAMNNNPISFNDPLGDIARIEGFTQEEVLNNLGKGLKLGEKQKNIFSFSDKGDLKYDKKAYKKLSSEQKVVADNIIGTIKDKKVFTLIKSDNSTVVQTKSDGTKLTLGDYGGGAVTVISDKKNAPNNVNVFLDPSFNFNDPSLGIKSTDPKATLDSPAWLVMYHEWGGHGFLKYVKNDPNQLGHTVDYENKVRSLNNMGERDYDEQHIKPDY